MDQSQARKIIHESLKPLRWIMGLQDWTIDIEYCHIPSEGKALYTKADVLTVDSHKKAKIRIDPAQHDDPADLLRSFRHELIHMLHAEMQLFKRQAIELLGAEDKTDNALEHAWVIGVEALVRKVEEMLDELGYSPTRMARVAMAKHSKWLAPKGKAKKNTRPKPEDDSKARYPRRCLRKGCRHRFTVNPPNPTARCPKCRFRTESTVLDKKR